MISETVIKELESIVGPEHLTTRHDDLTDYSSDATKLEFMPDAVAFPGAAEQISRILLLANREYFPVIPRGAGSGTSGGALPVKGGLVLAMDRFNRILSIDQDNLVVKVEPGVITAHLQEEVEKLGLFYPPDPEDRTEIFLLQILYTSISLPSSFALMHHYEPQRLLGCL